MNTKKYFNEIFEKTEKQDPVIDALRALSVLSIIAFHVMVGIIQIYDSAKAQQYILNMPKILQPLWHGEKGVDAFFLLSGLVIGLSFFKNVETYNFKSAVEFYKKKFLRIYPLFFVALCLYTLAQWSFYGRYFLSNLFFLNNIIPGERTIIPVGWFLTVEVQYFFLTPIVFLVLKKIKARGIALIGLFGFSILACAWALINNESLYLRPITDMFLAVDHDQFTAQMGRAFYEANLTRFGPYVAGFFLAYLKIFYSENLKIFFNSKIKSAMAVVVAGAFMLVPTMLPIYNPGSWYYNNFSSSLNFWTLALSRQVFSVGVLVLILGCWYSGAVFKTVVKVFSFSAWRPLSRLSFPMYLFHFPFIGLAAILVLGTTNLKLITNISFIQGMAVFILASLGTFLFSIPFYLYIERPIINRIKK